MSRTINLVAILDLTRKVFPDAVLLLTSRGDTIFMRDMYALRLVVPRGSKEFHGELSIDDNMPDSHIARCLIDYVVRAMIND